MSRLGGNVEKAKLLALFQFTCRGIPFTYYGDEIGIPRVRIPLKQGQDAVAIQHKWVPQFLVDSSKEILNRDECRTPMLWDEKPNAGFCSDSIKPWLPIAENFREINVAKQSRDAHSLLNFYRQAIRLRNATPALNEGRLEIAEDICNGRLLAYYRIFGGERLAVLLNMSASTVKNPLEHGHIAISTHHGAEASRLQPFEGRVVKPE
jgi:oligo-1,6-glucosidase/alpha-glucosidase